MDIGAEVRAWLDQHWDPQVAQKDWLALVVDAGYAVPRWPVKWHGRGLSPEDGRIVESEFLPRGAPGSGQDTANLWANTVLAHGTDDLRNLFLRPLLTDDLGMCLLYSEPGAGSDLAGLQTRAVRDGDDWIVTGQKVWTSFAHTAEYAFLLARTDWDVPKHQGITFFLFPMRQTGVEVRPIRQITGEAEFNEVFLTDARVPHAHVLGQVNDGWRVLQTALVYERVLMGGASGDPLERGASGDAERASRHSMHGADLDLTELAQTVGRNHDPNIRQALAQLRCLRMVNLWNGLRASAAMKQGSASPVASLGKLAMSRLLHTAGRVNAAILGAEAMLDGPEHPHAKAAAFSALNAYFTSIGGGTDQIQRNIIGERILGLPREPQIDRDVPFRDVLKSPS